MALSIAPTTTIEKIKDVNEFWKNKEKIESGKVAKEKLQLKATELYEQLNG